MTAYARAWKRNAMLAPEDGSVAAFVAWMRDELGWTGIHMQKDLWCEYVMICKLSRFKPVKEKWFGRELGKAGFKPYQIDKRTRGKGPRPMAVDLSEMIEEDAIAANNVAAIIAENSTSAIGAKSQTIEIETRIAA